MKIKTVIESQYRASLEMLRRTIEKCPGDLWLGPGKQNPSWRVAYHAVFYTHLYLQVSGAEFKTWPRHRELSELFVAPPWDPGAKVDEVQPYTQADVLEYLDFVNAQLKSWIDLIDLDGPSGFDWLPFNKLELQFYNIRHLMQHTGELSERLGTLGIEVDWIGSI